MTIGESVNRPRRRTPAFRTLAAVTALAVAAAGIPARAQSPPGGLPLIRDAEIEQLLREYTAPILRAAGLGQQNVRIVIINDRAFNAFVVDGRRIFVNVGALMDAKTSVRVELLKLRVSFLPPLILVFAFKPGVLEPQVA